MMRTTRWPFASTTTFGMAASARNRSGWPSTISASASFASRVQLIGKPNRVCRDEAIDVWIYVGWGCVVVRDAETERELEGPSTDCGGIPTARAFVQDDIEAMSP